MPECVQIKPEEVDIFLKGGGALDINSVRKKPKVCRSVAYDLPLNCRPRHKD